MKSPKFLEMNSNPHESDLPEVGIHIRRCIQSDIDSIRYLQPNGWDDITKFFQFYCNHSFCYPIVALAQEQIVGVAAGILNVTTGWLAHIIVSEAHRGRGIGFRLTQHIIDHLHRQNCTSLLLIATAMGEPVYRKCGFVTVTEYQFYRGDQIPFESASAHIKNVLPEHRSQVFELDEIISGEQRQDMLDNFLANGWVYWADSKIRGYFLPDFGEGTIIAADDEAGLELLKFKLSLKSSKAVVPAENLKAIQFLEASGFEKFNQAKRMVLGNAIQWKPELIYSRAGGFYG